MKKSVVFLVHITFWAVIYVTIYTVLHTILKNPFPPVGFNPFWSYEWLTIFVMIGVLTPFYSFYFLLPKLIDKKNRLIWYSIALIFLISYPYIALHLSDEVKTIDASNYSSSFLFYMFFAFVGGLFRVLFNWIVQNKQRDNLEKQNLKSELALLKYQINPHFLFNTLNNIDSLMHENVQNASKALNKLSEIMRYMIYDSEKEKVSFKEELAYIESYISLQKLRLTDENKISFNITGNIDNVQIAPMLFITFVENAFKHSSLKKNGSSIVIKFDVSENQVKFSCINSLTSSPSERDETSGIGLELIKKRLELIYPKSHELIVDKKEQSYAVYLKIKSNAN